MKIYYLKKSLSFLEAIALASVSTMKSNFICECYEIQCLSLSKLQVLQIKTCKSHRHIYIYST